MFPVRYELDLYIVFRMNSVFKGLITENNVIMSIMRMLTGRWDYLHFPQSAICNLRQFYTLEYNNEKFQTYPLRRSLSSGM
jgi:hypothetical protein